MFVAAVVPLSAAASVESLPNDLMERVQTLAAVVLAAAVVATAAVPAGHSK